MKTIWLSHVLEPDSPLYGGEKGIKIFPDKSMGKGDSCNTSVLEFPSHAGTHVDVPRHFIKNGRMLEEYSSDSWVFDGVQVIDIAATPGQLIGVKEIPDSLPESNKVDLILFRTDFESHRGTELYWENSPGLSADLALFLKDRFQNLRAIGMDFISISSLAHRDEGREAHRTFLKNGLFIFEDMALSNISSNACIGRIVAAPLRFRQGDGAPCTIIGFLSE